MRLITLIPITAVLALAQNPPPASFDCAADGTVVNSVTGEPVVRAHVNLISGGTTYSATTDASGKWSLSNLGCAPGQVQVTRPGFLQNAPFRGIALVSGSPVRDFKTALTPQSVAWGKVLDDQGDPVMGVQITALASRVVEGLPRFQQSGAATTNDLGEYRLANLQRGKYVFCAHMNAPNGTVQQASRMITADSCYPGPLEGGAASAMDIPAGRETKVDFTLDQVAAVHVRGTVTGLPEGRTVGVNLVKRGVTADFGGNLGGAVRAGSFDFRAPPGSYMLTSDYFEAARRFTARVPIEVGSSDIDNIVVHLDSGFTVTGVVRLASQSGQTAPAPQFGINLRASEPVNGTGQLKWDQDHTSFAINDLVPGNFRLDVSPPAPFYVKSATLAGQDILNSEVSISQAAGPIEINLRDDSGSIEGDVVDANGQPAAAGILLLRGTLRAANVIMAQANGHFKLQNVAPGDYNVCAWDTWNEVEYANPDWMRRYGGGGLPVTVTAGQNAQVKLTRQLVPAQ
jgi:hypothetical protein